MSTGINSTISIMNQISKAKRPGVTWNTGMMETREEKKQIDSLCTVHINQTNQPTDQPNLHPHRKPLRTNLLNKKYARKGPWRNNRFLVILVSFSSPPGHLHTTVLFKVQNG